MTQKCFNNIIIAIIISIACVTIGFGIYATYEYSQRNVYKNADYVCGSFKNLTILTMTKNIWKIWHWQYDGENIYFRQRCPTFTHDAEIYIGNTLVSKTDGKIFNLDSTYYIKDCHGVITNIIKTSSFSQTIINSNNIWTSLLLYTSNGTLIAYIDSDIFVTGNVQLKNISGYTIANINKNIGGISWSWSYEIFDKSHITMDVLVAITSKLSFMPRFFEKNNKMDMCNNFFLSVGIISLVFLCLFFVGGIVYVIFYLRKKTSK